MNVAQIGALTSVQSPEVRPLRLSVVIPCYNELATIDAIIDAVNNWPYPNREIIVVDDFSIDGTRRPKRKLPNRVASPGFSITMPIAAKALPFERGLERRRVV